MPVVPAKCMYKATINTKLEDLVKNYIDYIDHVFFRNLADVSLTDEDTNSILTDTANRAFQGSLQLMQVTQPGLVGKLMEVVAKFATDASGAIWWPNLQLMQVEPSGGQICN